MPRRHRSYAENKFMGYAMIVAFEGLSIGNVESMLAILGMLTGWLLLAWRWAATQKERLAANQRVHEELVKKVDTLWSLYMSRGQAETVIRGLTVDSVSPRTKIDARLLLNPKVRAMLEPIAALLHEVWNTHKERGRQAVEMAIEEQFRDWLITNICIPLGLFNSGCIALAFEVAREEEIREVRHEHPTGGR